MERQLVQIRTQTHYNRIGRPLATEHRISYEQLNPYIPGILYDCTQNYDISFIVSGSFLVLSALMCYPVDKISRWEKSRAKLNGTPKV